MASPMQNLTASEVIALLHLQPHPEGGHYLETYRDPNDHGGRSHSSAIYFLLAANEVSHWHRVDAMEIWHWYAGAPLKLRISIAPGQMEACVLGPEIPAGQRPQVIIPPF